MKLSDIKTIKLVEELKDESEKLSEDCFSFDETQVNQF